MKNLKIYGSKSPCFLFFLLQQPSSARIQPKHPIPRKNHLINSISNHLSLPKNESLAVLESLLELIKKTLADGEDILISGFGKFNVNEKSERRGRNPMTGE